MNSEIEFRYFTGNESEMLTFYRIPKMLITDKHFRSISNDAKILYGLMLDRMSLSAKNGWIDKNNHVFIFFSIDDIMEYLSCGKNKAVKTIGELDSENGIGLIERKRQGLGKPSLVYVKNFVYRTEATRPEVYKVNFRNPINQTSKGCKTKHSEVCEEDTNKNKENNTKSNNNKSNLFAPTRRNEKISGCLADIAGYAALIRSNIEYDVLHDRFPYDQDIIEELYELILETLLSKKDEIVIASDRYPTELVKSRFLKLRFEHMVYVINCMKNNPTKVRNIKKYMMTVLFNSVVTMGNYYQAEVNNDMQMAGLGTIS